MTLTGSKPDDRFTLSSLPSPIKSSANIFNLGTGTLLNDTYLNSSDY